MRYALLLAAFACAAAAPATYRCPKTGLPPVLNGDPFVPVECSTAPKAALPLPAEPDGAPAAPEFKSLRGSWEGLLVRGFGRYASTLEVKPGKRGATELTLRWKELQLRSTGHSTLTLTPEKQPGRARASLQASLLPDARLEGDASFSVEASSGAAAGRRLDLRFPNGAAHRVRWSQPSKDRLLFKAVWGVPEAPLQTLEGELRRAGS
ncbi:MAG: hypothetical protein SF051_03900 [Elusimicrobiota bacterium]|nr:hypothetical protein [Elusimicrobiota bacterium]